jgi:2-polyprenyl-6-methoxyphenol hydroxylase-like FAD-dependent oxidoreductase
VHTTSLLISGGGIAGSTLAALAARAGFEVTVVERAAGERSSGSPVDVHGGAYAVAEALGVVDRMRSAATGTRELTIVDAAGHPVARMPINSARDPRHIEIPRAELAEILAGAGADDYEVFRSDELTSVGEGPHGVDVEFAGAAPRRFDLVVGADGLHSGVRRLAFGPEGDYVRFLGMYVATVRLDEPPGDPARVLLYNEPGISTTVHPVTGHPGAGFIFRSRERVHHRDRDGRLALLRATYGDAGWRSRELLEVYAASDDVYFDSVSQVRMPAWSTGRVGLVGDAASSLSLFGDGSSSAITGAATLAQELVAARDAGSDWGAAFGRYERRHRRVVAPNVRGFGVASRVIVPATSRGIAARNLLMRTVAAFMRPAGSART